MRKEKKNHKHRKKISGVDQSMVSAGGSRGAYICFVPRRHLGTNEDSADRAHGTGHRSLLSGLPSVNEPGSWLVNLGNALFVRRMMRIAHRARRRRKRGSTPNFEFRTRGCR